MSLSGLKSSASRKDKLIGAPGSDTAPQFGQVLRGFVILSVAVIMSLIVFFAVFSSRSHTRSITDTEKLTQTLADLIDDQTFRSLQNIQLMLNSVREAVLEKETNPFAGIADVMRNNAIVRGFVITDAQGTITFSSYATQDLGWSLRNDELFERLRQSRTPVAIGKPINGRSYTDQTGEGPSFIPAALQITDSSGVFRGLVIAALNPSVLELQVQTIAENNRAIVSLFRYDGVLLIGGADRRSIGKSMAAGNPIFTQFLPDRERGTFSTLPTRENSGQIISFNVTHLWPIIVSIAIKRSDALEAWRDDTLFTAFIMLVPVLLIGGSASLMGRQILALRQQSDLVAQRETDAIAARYQLELAINAMSDGFCYFDADDRLVLSNSTYRALYPDISHLIVPGQSCEEFCREILRSGHFKVPLENQKAWIAKRLARHRDVSEPFEEQLLDGRWFRILNQQTPDGGWVGLRTDITELKLREQQLVEAREAADAANIAKSQFLAQMSHEIRTPMNGILGMTAMLGDSSLTQKQNSYLTVIDKSAHSLLRVINDILDFSQLEAGRMKLEPVSYRLEETINDVIGLVSSEANARNLPIKVVLTPETPNWLYGDQDRLRQILVNLLANAIKFTEQGEVAVTTDLIPRSGEPATEWLEISVSDTGVGISDDAQTRLFQHFEQGDAGVHRRYGGSGLGLAICKKIVTAMGGEIGVESKRGKGSRFWFRIPAIRSQETGRPANAPLETTAFGSLRLRVLVAEDNQINQLVVRALLERLGHSCQTVSNGLEAVRAVQDAPFDMVLMDVQMPEMDGVEATRAIRSLKGEFADLPIIAVTANVLPGDATRYAREGMNGVISKPIEPALLRSMLEGHALEGAGALHKESTATQESLPSVEEIHAIDFDVIDDMRNAVGNDIYLSLMTDLNRDVQRHLEMITIGLDRDDPDELRRGAHSLSSLLSTFGLTNAGAAFGRVEVLLRANKIDDARALGTHLNRETAAAMAGLTEKVVNAARTG